MHTCTYTHKNTRAHTKTKMSAKHPQVLRVKVSLLSLTPPALSRFPMLIVGNSLLGAPASRHFSKYANLQVFKCVPIGLPSMYWSATYVFTAVARAGFHLIT